MAAGSIIVDLLMRTGSFETDTKKAARTLQREFKQMQTEAVVTGRLIGDAIVQGVKLAAQAFKLLTAGAAEFKDLEEMTGASAEDLASLAIAAETAGVGMQTLAANSIRLTKGLTGVDDESKAAGSAIAALGLNLADFKALDPVAQIDALTKAFASFKDGPEKSAVALALWGKSGVEMLKVLKALEEQGGRTKILTQAQIELADAYADAQAKSTAELKLYAQAAASFALPALTALITETKKAAGEMLGLDATTGKLGANTGVRDFAEGAAIAVAIVGESVVGLLKATRALGGSFEAVFADVELAVAFAAKLQVLNRGGLFNAENRAELSASLEKRNRIAEEANERYVRLWVDSGTKVSDALRLQFSDVGRINSRIQADPTELARRGRPVGGFEKPLVPFEGVVGKSKGAKAAKAEVDEVAKAVQALEEELALFGQSDAFNKAFKLEGLGATTAQVEEYRRKLAELEELKTAAAIEEAIAALVKERDELGLTSEQLAIHKLALQGAGEDQIRYAQSVLGATKAARDQKDAVDEGKRLYEQTRTPIEALNIELTRLADLLQRGAVDWDTYSRAVFAAQDKFDATTKKAEESVDSFTKKFAENTQDILGQGLYDMMSGNFKNIGDSFAQMINRMVAEALAADLARAMFGDLVKGGQGQGGGFFGSLLKGAGEFFGGFFAAGGDPPMNKVSIVGERGPELFVPRTAGTVIPLDKAQRRSEGGVSIANNFSIVGPVDRRTEEQIAAAAFRGAQRANFRRTS